MTVIVCSPFNLPQSQEVNEPFSSFSLFRPIGAIDAFCCDECTPDLKPNSNFTETKLPPSVLYGKNHKISGNKAPAYVEQQKRLTEFRRRRYNRPKKSGKKKQRQEAMARGQKKNKYLNSKIKRKILHDRYTGRQFCCGGGWQNKCAARISRKRKKESANNWEENLLTVRPADAQHCRKRSYGIRVDRCSSLYRPIFVC